MPDHTTAMLMHSLVTHAVFGMGLYAAGWVARLIADSNWSLA